MKKPLILFLDCETNGLPIDYKASYTDVDNWPRVISLGWELTTADNSILESRHHLIRPDGWQMPTDEFWINNGYTQERSEREGLPIVEVLTSLKAAKEKADILVAHNLNFDHRIIWAEFIRAGMEPRSGMHKICTMMKSTAVCQIPAAKGRGFKWPKLEEAYSILLNKQMEGAHDASFDVAACREIFFELVRRGVVTTELPADSLS